MGLVRRLERGRGEKEEPKRPFRRNAEEYRVDRASTLKGRANRARHAGERLGKKELKARGKIILNRKG